MPKRYKKPPVVEATCTFLFDAESSEDITIPGLMYGHLRDAYPVRHRAAASDVQEGKGESVNLAVRGVAKFSTEDGRSIVQVAPRSLSISQLPPYEGWGKLIVRIERALAAYVLTVNPKEIQGSLLAYNNRIDLPNPPVRIEDFLDFYPYLGERLPQEISLFSLSVQRAYEDRHEALQMQLQSWNQPSNLAVSLMLLLSYTSNEKRHASWEAVSELLELAHSRVSESFEGSLKDSARSLFEPV